MANEALRCEVWQCLGGEDERRSDMLSPTAPTTVAPAASTAVRAGPIKMLLLVSKIVARGSALEGTDMLSEREIQLWRHGHAADRENYSPPLLRPDAYKLHGTVMVDFMAIGITVGASNGFTGHLHLRRAQAAERGSTTPSPLPTSTATRSRATQNAMILSNATLLTYKPTLTWATPPTAITHTTPR